MVAYSIEQILECISKYICNEEEFSSLSTYNQDIGVFLEKCYCLFSSWSGFFSYSFLNTRDRDYFLQRFKDFLNECGNGSWSSMRMSLSDLTINSSKDMIYDQCKNISKHSINPDRIMELLLDYRSPASTRHIRGMSEFHWSAVAFATNEKTNMIIDGPVKAFFARKFGIGNDEVTSRYTDVVAYSENLADKFSVKMWHVNKAYAVFERRGFMGLKTLCEKIPLIHGNREVLLTDC